MKRALRHWPARLALAFGCVAGGVPALAPQAARAEPVAPSDEPAFIAPAKQFAVKILRGEVPVGDFLGSGFAWMSRGRALAVTNLHVAQRGVAAGAPGALLVGFAAPVLWRPAVKVLGLPGSDLAVIETNVEAPQGTPYALGTVGPGEVVYSVGYDEKVFGGEAPVVHRGRVVGAGGVMLGSQYHAVRPPYPPDAVQAYFVEDANCRPGASGSMILNSKGELVGYLQGGIEGGICVVLPIAELQRALARAGF